MVDSFSSLQAKAYSSFKLSFVENEMATSLAAVITCKPHRLSRIGCFAASFVGQPLRSCSAPSGLPCCARFRSHGTGTEKKHERPTGSEPPTGNSDHRRGGGGWVGGNRLHGMAWQSQVSGWGKLGGMFVFEWCDAPGYPWRATPF